MSLKYLHRDDDDDDEDEDDEDEDDEGDRQGLRGRDDVRSVGRAGPGCLPSSARSQHGAAGGRVEGRERPFCLPGV